MKKLKKILSILLIIPVMFLFVACGKDPETPPPSDNGGSQTTPSLSVSDSFAMSKELIDDFFLDYATEDALKNDYADVIKKDISILDATTELLSIYTPFNWHCGLVVAAEEGEVNKLNKFYLDDSSTDEKVDVEVIMQFSYDGLDEKYSYKFYCFDIEVVKATNEVVIECFSEESSASGLNNSTAKYHSFKLTGKCGETNEVNLLNFYTFERNTKIDEPSSSTVDNNTIKNFEGCKVLSEQENIFYLKENSDSNMANENSVQAGVALEIVSRVYAEVSQIPPKAFTILETASSILCPLVNA